MLILKDILCNFRKSYWTHLYQSCPSESYYPSLPCKRMRFSLPLQRRKNSSAKKNGYMVGPISQDFVGALYLLFVIGMSKASWIRPHAESEHSTFLTNNGFVSILRECCQKKSRSVSIFYPHTSKTKNVEKS